MYHTKTIASILEPVAQQVSKLIILHEEGEDGNAMPQLDGPVAAVSKAVTNLVRVGRDTVNGSQDPKLRDNMPKAIKVVESASTLLENACTDLRNDPYSQSGRDQLIAGSRAILQGTTSMLLIFDESKMSKIIKDCKKVLDYLAISEVIETMDDLVQFVKDLSPCLSKMSVDVEARYKDLINLSHSESIKRCLEQIKTLAPILVCSMKIFIQILHQGGKETEEAIENRNYLAKRMTEETSEIIHYLSLSAEKDNYINGMNEKDNQGHSFTTLNIAGKNLKTYLFDANGSDINIINEHVYTVTNLANEIVNYFDEVDKENFIKCINDLEYNSKKLLQNSNAISENKIAINDMVKKLVNTANIIVISNIVHDMVDLTSPLKLFNESLLSNEKTSRKREAAAQALRNLSTKLSKISNTLALICARSKSNQYSLQLLPKQLLNLTPQLINAATIKVSYPENKSANENLDNLMNQYAHIVQTIRDICDESIDIELFVNKTSEKVSDEIVNCETSIRMNDSQRLIQCASLIARLANRLLITLIHESENSDDQNLKMKVNSITEKIKNVISPFLDNSKHVAADVKNENNIDMWKRSTERLMATLEEVLRLCMDLNGCTNFPKEEVEFPIHIEKQNAAPPRPPLPVETMMETFSPPRPPMPDITDEDAIFDQNTGTNRPIRVAAQGLYQEVRQWDHTDNDLIAAAKKIALLMAQLSDLIRGGRGTKKELISCSKALADASEKIAELSKELARHCTDKKIRTNLLQVCEKIPTLGTQLRVLSTVKATMMGSNLDSEEDIEAMDMLVFNAQKLNLAVKDTIRAAEAASIRVRSDAGFKLKWVRKQPWYQ